jgi:hypothetical protein
MRGALFVLIRGRASRRDRAGLLDAGIISTGLGLLTWAFSCVRSLGADATGIDMVLEFIAHAQAAHPSGSYQLGSFDNLAAATHSITGILDWGSLIHLYCRKISTACSPSSGE